MSSAASTAEQFEKDSTAFNLPHFNLILCLFSKVDHFWNKLIDHKNDSTVH